MVYFYCAFKCVFLLWVAEPNDRTVAEAISLLDDVDYYGRVISLNIRFEEGYNQIYLCHNYYTYKPSSIPNKALHSTVS